MNLYLAIGVLAIGCSGALAAESAVTNKTSKPQAPAAASTSTNAAPDEVIAKGKGFEIKRKQLDEAMATIKGSMRGQEMPPEQLEAIRPQMLDRLIAMRLLSLKATEADKTKAQETTQKRIAEIHQNFGGEEGLASQLKSHGITPDEFKAKLTEETLAEVVLEREIEVKVDDAEIKKFYDENPSRFEQPEMVRAAHILKMTLDESGKPLADDKKKEKLTQIEDLLKKARAGEDFAKLAKEHSEDPGSKDKGGEYEFPRGQMVPEFEKAAFALNTNEISDVVTTQYGYHIIKLYEKKAAKKESFADVQDTIRSALKSQELRKEMPAYIEKLKTEAGVKILDERLKPKPMPDMSGPGGAVKDPAKPEKKSPTN